MADAEKGIRITVEDLETGDTESTVIWDNYLLITAGSAHLHGVHAHATGTHVLTVRGVRRSA